jgi:TonB family protein
MKLKWILTWLVIAIASAANVVSASPVADSDSVVVAPDVLPQFEGGESAMYQFLMTHILWPSDAPNEDVKVRALVEFVVEKDGLLSNVAIKQSTGYEVFDSEAVRVVRQMPKWTPGTKGGEVVRTTFVLPIRFQSTSGNDLK